MKIDVAENNNNYSGADGVLFNKAQTQLISYAKGNLENEYLIPDSVTSIGNHAFSGCSGLMSITIPDSVTSIGSNAFSYCSSLTSIEIPDSVTCIKSGAFYGCKSLSSITIPYTVESIGSSAFKYCSSDLVIKGYTGSIAETYATENSITFESIGVILTQETTPEIAINYANEVLTGFEDEASYTIDGVAVTVENGTLPVADYMGKTIQVVRKGNGVTTNDSEAQIVVIPSRAAAPVTDDFTVTQPSEIDGTGSISGITDTMEYSTDGGLTWNVGESDISEIVGGTTYLVRYRVTDSGFKSESYTITIVAVEDTSIRIVLTVNSVKALNVDSGVLIVAGFDESGAMTKIEFIDGYEAELNGYEECSIIRAFLWNDLKEMLPVCNNALVEI